MRQEVKRAASEHGWAAAKEDVDGLSGDGTRTTGRRGRGRAVGGTMVVGGESRRGSCSGLTRRRTYTRIHRPPAELQHNQTVAIASLFPPRPRLALCRPLVPVSFSLHCREPLFHPHPPYVDPSYFLPQMHRGATLNCTGLFIRRPRGVSGKGIA
ncbi:uncharacterized protein LAESUDRAFT_199313 [Laetiporus sulphureus 93-53]|uniref:Uncharacterized protein n=1 Tax=Laetiporus sulphureus 93-53 TaxID=1314785 RepID=A0A165E2M3_9APHY|nr:uncharacterized protein LAESUDRAFT_199313 [Laetiporus sulphureus 93-53]KZT06127.1 hypothetical protein LAESUDRAFT_199313 [Laetiporus sulphureus 93-53]